MIDIQMYVNKEKVDELSLSEKEAFRISEVLLNYANEIKVREDIKAVMLGSMLKEVVSKKVER